MLNIVAVLMINPMNQGCKFTPGAAGSRPACGRAIGTFVPGHADVAGDQEDGPVDGASVHWAGPEESQEGLHKGRVRPFRVPAVDEAPADVGTVR